MPPVLAYSVNFASGSLHPDADGQGWGDMVFGGTTAGTLQRNFVAGGLSLTATRPSTTDPTDGVVNGVYVVLPPPDAAGNPVRGTLLRATRLQMRAEFDLPDATPEDPNAPVPIWAVALRVKLGNATDIQGDQTLINVTCQFNKDGVRLADPNRAQDAPSNTPTNLDSPLSYGSYRPGCFGWWGPTKFNLDFAYSGIQAGPAPAHPHQVGEDLGYAVGCGFLEMLDVPKWGGLFDGPKLLLNLQNKYDRRVFSSTNLSTTDQSWIGALGVSIGTINYVGTMTARLKRFSVSLWV